MIHFYTSLIITVVPYPGEPGTEVSEPRYLSETLPIECVQADFFLPVRLLFLSDQHDFQSLKSGKLWEVKDSQLA